MRAGRAIFSTVLLSGCTALNPAFFASATDESTAEPETTATPTTSTSDEVATSTGAIDETGALASSTADGSTSGESTTQPVASTTTVTTDASTSSGPGGSTDAATTDIESEQLLELDAEVATCVLAKQPFKPHIGPAGCEQRTAAALGLPGGAMIVDNAFYEQGDGRPGVVYMRFVFPPELAGATLVDAVLELAVADTLSSGSLSAGALGPAEPFEPADLDVGAPAPMPGDYLLLGELQPGQPLVIPLSLQAVDLDAPLHLGIWPNSDDGAAFLSNAAPAGRPRLIVTYQP